MISYFNFNAARGAICGALGTFALLLPSTEVEASSFNVFNVRDNVETGIITETDNNVSIDYYNFRVNRSTNVSIDVLSRNVLDGDPDSAGAAGTELSQLNSTIQLFEFDETGDLMLLGDFLASNNNTPGGPANADGSVSPLDSFVSGFLNPGRYVLAISESIFTETEARAGHNEDILNGSFAEYQLTFSGIALVPVPPTLPLMLAGLAGLAYVARRRRSE